MTLTPLGAAAPSAFRAVMRDLVQRHRLRLMLTYSLTLAEAALAVLLPLALAFAIDGLLAGRRLALVPFAALWLLHLAVGAARHVYDTRAFTAILNDLVVGSVAGLRRSRVPRSVIIGRVGLADELIDFLQVEVPAVVSVAVAIAGNAAMLLWLDAVTGLVALAALVPLGFGALAFGRRALRLNVGLNNRNDAQAGIVGRAPLAMVARHFERQSWWRIRISNAEAGVWSAIEVVMLGLMLVALLRAAGGEVATVGTIYATVAYVRDLAGAANDLPNIVQNAARARDIAERLAGAAKPV